MNVGLAPFSDADLTFLGSIQRVRRATEAAIASRHVVVPFPDDDPAMPRTQRRERLASWIAKCDAIVGPINRDVLDARQAVKWPVPFACFMLGGMSRGAWGLSAAWRYLRTFDVLIVNCTSDAAIAKKFCPNATVHVVPFAFDEERFYRADEASRAAARRTLGLSSEDRMILYSGRITLEKNIQTIFRVVKVVQNVLPDVSLVLAGDEMNTPFPDFGVIPLSIKRSLRRLRDHLHLRTGRVLLISQRSSDDLRGLYSAADVLVNLTLNHDENFGLAQIEAMACGLPCVGTAWGGLKDTIEHGVTGFQVPTIVTSVGTKVDWWTAANAVVDILMMDASARDDMRRRCQELARERYSADGYRERLDRALAHGTAAATAATEPLSPSAFAEEYWAHCKRDVDGSPPYRRGPAGLRFYRELITPFAAGAIPAPADPGATVWCLAVPLAIASPDTLVVDDLIFPFEISIPVELNDAVRKLTALFAGRPVQTGSIASKLGLDGMHALDWMVRTGLILSSRPGTIELRHASATIGCPTFTMRPVHYDTDVIVLS